MTTRIPTMYGRYYVLTCVWRGREFDITVDNITKMMEYKLFDFEKYCTICMDIIPPRPEARKLEILEKIALEK